MGGHLRWMLVGALMMMNLGACAGTNRMAHEEAPPDDPVMGLLSKGITQLNVNINALSKRLSDAQPAPGGTDPVLQELQALDLAGWQLHQQQWMLQRDHLTLARETLQRAAKNPGEKGQLLDQWRQHREQYLKAVEELRRQRQNLENKHLEVEARLVQRGLQ